MKLTNFEEFIDNEILDRGERYFYNSHVEGISEIDKNHFVVEVTGSDLYHVHVFINKHKEIVDTSCDCPFDWGPFCKHQVAAFYALRNNENSNKDRTDQKMRSKPKLDLPTILANLNKEELINIVQSITKEYPEIEKKLLYKYTQDEQDLVRSSKKLIKDYIRQYKRRGFIEWNVVYEALEGARLTLKKVEELLENKEADPALKLSILVFTEAVDMIEYTDDSSGFIGGVIDDSLDFMNDSILLGIEIWNEAQSDQIFNMLMKEARHNRLDGWSDWRYRLFSLCTLLCGNSGRRKKLEEELTNRLNVLQEGTWNWQYDRARIKEIQLELIERFDGEEQTEAFIYENIELSTFREKAIKYALSKGQFTKVIELSEKGEENDQRYPGLVHKWKVYKLQAYEGLGEIDKQRNLLMQFVLSGHFEYYQQLKESYLAEEWEDILFQLFGILESNDNLPNVYLSIAQEEGMKEKILTYVLQNLFLIQYVYNDILDEYPEETERIFKEYIRGEAQHASDRRKYRQVCRIIKEFRKACGKDAAEEIIEELEQKNNRRPAFLDELSKIK